MIQLLVLPFVAAAMGMLVADKQKADREAREKEEEYKQQKAKEREETNRRRAEARNAGGGGANYVQTPVYRFSKRDGSLNRF